jgi:hypothetical protein
MNKIKILLSAVLLLNISPAHAMENATNAVNEKRTVPIVIDGPRKVCTGFLYSERIVLTAGHCLSDRDAKKPYQKHYIGLPGIPYSKDNAKLIEAEKVIFPKNWSLKGENDFTDIEDFGILILKESISINGKTTIATQEQIDLYIKNKTLVSTVGYGIQSVSHKQNDLTAPQYAEFPLESLDIVKTVLNTNKYYGMKINTVQIPGGPGTCPGDSGSAFYIKDGKEISDWFAFENDFINSINSFHLNIPSPHYIDLLETSTIVEVSRDAISMLTEKHHCFEKLGRIAVTKTMLQLQQRIASIQFESALQKYESLLTMRPDITQRVPLTHIASYLGITLETLSRIRNPKNRI